ncbi:MAG: transcriptional repressor [Chloroflexi bacterium]|nr:transcriptional repressor [Chloroflexota bacterium]
MTRHSRQKETILKILKETNSHPTADWIYSEVRKEIPNVSLGTVYRNLRVLKQEGKVLELDLVGNVTRYDGNHRNHDHFRCEKCGRVFDLNGAVDAGALEMDKKISKRTGFKVLYHRLEFRGFCKDCKSSDFSGGLSG